MITILYFGQLSQHLNTASEQMDWPGGSTDELLAFLRARGEPWRSALHVDNVFKVALNQVLLHASTQIPDGSEIGILPPVTGG